MEAASLPTLDLVVATVGRTAEPAALLASLERQTHQGFRVIVVDQNDDDRLAPVLAGHPTLAIVQLRSARGLARARNTGLGAVEAELVGFPDDDCAYPADLVERVVARFAAMPALDGVTGRTADASGQSHGRWRQNGRTLDRETVWHGGNSASTFLRRSVINRAGGFDEALGLGAGTPWASGEDTELLVRVLSLGAHVEYDPGLIVLHELRTADHLPALGSREGGAVGYILGKHRYPPRTVARMLVRPAAGVMVRLAHGDLEGARFQARTLAGRARGYLAGRRAVSSANNSA